MTATLRIHRGPAHKDRMLLLDAQKLGHLTDAVTEFEVAQGKHTVSLSLGIYHSVATHLHVHDGDVVDLYVEENPEEAAALLQGGFLRFRSYEEPHLHTGRAHPPT